MSFIYFLTRILVVLAAAAVSPETPSVIYAVRPNGHIWCIFFVYRYAYYPHEVSCCCLNLAAAKSLLWAEFCITVAWHASCEKDNRVEHDMKIFWPPVIIPIPAFLQNFTHPRQFLGPCILSLLSILEKIPIRDSGPPKSLPGNRHLFALFSCFQCRSL
jgi:hypothetical protein